MKYLLIIAVIVICQKGYAKDIYIYSIAEVYTPEESTPAIICCINNTSKTIDINWDIKNIGGAINNARKRGIEIHPCSRVDLIICEGHIVIMKSVGKVFIFDSISLADELLKP